MAVRLDVDYYYFPHYRLGCGNDCTEMRILVFGCFILRDIEFIHLFICLYSILEIRADSQSLFTRWIYISWSPGNSIFHRRMDKTLASETQETSNNDRRRVKVLLHANSPRRGRSNLAQANGLGQDSLWIISPERAARNVIFAFLKSHYRLACLPLAPPFQGFVCYDIFSPRRCLGLTSHCPFGA